MRIINIILNKNIYVHFSNVFLYIFSTDTKLMNAMEQNLLSNCMHVCIFYPKEKNSISQKKSNLKNSLYEIIKRF